MRHKIRCAIYTRKSSEEGLDQDFNSLDAQREACESYIASQKAEGWVCLSSRYDDGGISGATMDRPALLRLLDDIEAGKVDQIIVYKIDRLTRSLSDFAKIIDRLDEAKASFVSVTQSFNTATSMGRLTLNMLLSFAQFEREVTAERIRDKITASKKKGLWMGGICPLGYRANGRTLIIDKKEAEIIRLIYQLYETHGSISNLKQAIDNKKLRTRSRLNKDGLEIGNNPFSRGHLYHILTNPIYAGRIRHGKIIHEGQHEAIIDPEEWDALQTRLIASGHKTRGKATTQHQHNLLNGKLFDETGDRLTPTQTSRNGRQHRYYVSRRLIVKKAEEHRDGWRLPAKPLEDAIRQGLLDYLNAQDFVTRLLSDAPADIISKAFKALSNLEETILYSDSTFWADLIQRVSLSKGKANITLNLKALYCLLGIEMSFLIDESLVIEIPLSIRKRGVETKLITGANPAYQDDTLIKNIALSRSWYNAIKQGKTLNEIAQENKTSLARIRHMIDLAFLSPDILQDISQGKQPSGLTSEWIKTHSIPSSWAKQHEFIASLS
jgi:DNA invertase Pin-like site-specific DNA recombinase